jgi:uncharacterized membrane protein
MVTRILKHLFLFPWITQRFLSTKESKAIESLIGESEKQHSGEIVFVVEDSLPISAVLKRTTARERAIEVFSMLGIWDTELNNGILLYVLLADKSFEILADRGVMQKIDAKKLEDIRTQIESSLAQKRCFEGIADGISALTQILIHHFPRLSGDTNELDNAVKRL